MERVDIILLGATGYTGTFTAKSLVKFSKNVPDNFKFTWGICGRSADKLKNLVKDLQAMDFDISPIKVYVCDVNSNDLQSVTSKARIVMNCTGPNTILSEPIVKACIATSTHYVDISAELYHMLDIYNKYHKVAEQANVLIVPACGYGVLPAMAGLMYLEKLYLGTLSTVECYTFFNIPKRAYFPGCNNCLIHCGTWESMIHEFGNHTKYKQLKKIVYPENIYEEEPPQIKKSFYHRKDGKVWFPYPGPDGDVVEFSQRYMYDKTKKPYHFKMYTTTPLLIQLILLSILFFFLYLLSSMRWFRKLLCRFPGFFSFGYFNHEGPSEEMARNTKFDMTFTGTGLDNKGVNKTMAVKVSGSDPGYSVTSDVFIVAALMLLKEKTKMPKGGVVAALAAFKDTSLVETLIQHKSLEFEVLN